MKYWVYINSQILGPYEKEQFSQVPGFTPETMVCPENPPDGKQEWLPAMSVTGSSAAAPAQAEPMPQQPPAQQSEAGTPLSMRLDASATGPASEPQPGAPLAAELQAGAPLSDTADSPFKVAEQPAPEASAPKSASALHIAVSDDGVDHRFSMVESAVKTHSGEIRAIERKLDEVAQTLASVQSELAALRQSSPTAAPLAAAAPVFTTASAAVEMPHQQPPQFDAQPSVPEFSVPASAATPGLEPGVIMPVPAPVEEPAAPVVVKEKKSKKPLIVVLLLAAIGGGLYFAHSSGLIGKTAAPPAEPPAPAVAVSTVTTPAPQPAVSEEMLKLIKAYEVMPGQSLESVISASAPQVTVSSIEWTMQLLDPTLYSVAIKVPPATPDTWQISYRFDYNVPENKLTAANTEATELLEKLKAAAAAAAAPPPPPPPPAPKPRKRAVKKPEAPKPVAQAAPKAAEEVEVIEVVEP